MNKLFKLNRSLPCFCVAVLGAVVVFGSAAAQSASNGQLLGGGIMEKFSASDVASMLSDFSIEAALEPYDGTASATMTAKTSGGAQFFISLFQCDEVATGRGCKQALIYTGISNAGVAYDDINTFNLNSDITTAVNISEQNIILFGMQIFSHGGIGRGNFQMLSALFLNDMQKYVDGRNASAATVSLQIVPSRGGKVDNFGEDQQTSLRQTSVISTHSVENALFAAVANTLKVGFLPESAASLVE